MSPLGKYSVYKDIARFEYACLLWSNPSAQKGLLAHWNNPEHPRHKRFLKNKTNIEEALRSQSSKEELDERFRKRNPDFRTIARKIPLAFDSIRRNGDQQNSKMTIIYDKTFKPFEF